MVSSVFSRVFVTDVTTFLRGASLFLSLSLSLSLLLSLSLSLSLSKSSQNVLPDLIKNASRVTGAAANELPGWQSWRQLLVSMTTCYEPPPRVSLVYGFVTYDESELDTSNRIINSLPVRGALVSDQQRTIGKQESTNREIYTRVIFVLPTTEWHSVLRVAISANENSVRCMNGVSRRWRVFLCFAVPSTALSMFGVFFVFIPMTFYLSRTPETFISKTMKDTHSLWFNYYISPDVRIIDSRRS